jgi:GNAT superfamily N-acetyltransferase
MIELIRTNSENKNFIELVKKLDAYLSIVDGDDHAFYHQYNKIDKLKSVVVAYEEGLPVACGAIKEFTPNAMEVKRMFTLQEYRGKGIASKVLYELEKWAAELGYKKCVLETGKRQADAVQLYKKSGYKLIQNYGQYTGMDNSVCFEKEIG